MLSSKDDKVEATIKNKLANLNFSQEQIDSLTKLPVKRANNAKLAQSGKCNKSSITITFWPFSSTKSKTSPECEAFNEDAAEQLITQNTLMMKSLLAATEIAGGKKIIARNLDKIDKSLKIVEQYPQDRIVKCLGLSNDLNNVAACSGSVASIETIETCTILKMSSDFALKCLNSKVDITSAKVCKDFVYTDADKLKCVELNPAPSIAAACKATIYPDSDKIKCLEIKPDPQVAAICKALLYPDAEKLECLKIKPELSVAQSCKDLLYGDTEKLKCIKLKPDASLAKACKSLFYEDIQKLLCVEINAPAEKVSQCGLKNLSDQEKIICIKQAYEAMANAKVNDTPRNVKESVVDEDSTTSASAGEAAAK